MSEKYLNEFKDIDFLTMLFREFRNKGIIEFNKRELENNLYYYKKNPKYVLLFQNVKEKGERVLLGSAIEILEKIGGLVQLSYNKDYGITDMVFPLKTCDELEALLLVKELVKEYELRKRVIETTHGNIKLYGVNPNAFYVLVNGYHGDKYIEWNLITDGKVTEKFSKEIEGTPLFWANPENEKTEIGIANGKYAEVEVQNASFAIANGKVNDEVKVSLFSSKSLKEKELRKEISYALTEKVPKNSFVKILSLEK